MSINNIRRESVRDFSLSHRTLDRYQQIATSKANWPGKGSALGLLYIAGKCAAEAGEMSGDVLKAIRDDAFGSSSLTPERRRAVIKEAGDVLWYLAALADELGTDLSEIALGNLDKLAGRTERGTLQGDGER